jgi:hypothetical protein
MDAVISRFWSPASEMGPAFRGLFGRAGKNFLIRIGSFLPLGAKEGKIRADTQK